jgi:hypothetical protein
MISSLQEPGNRTNCDRQLHVMGKKKRLIGNPNKITIQVLQLDFNNTDVHYMGGILKILRKILAKRRDLGKPALNLRARRFLTLSSGGSHNSGIAGPSHEI